MSKLLKWNDQSSIFEIVEHTAQDIATDALNHIDTMYPDMWIGVPKAARLSLRNTIYNSAKLKTNEAIDAVFDDAEVDGE